MEHYPSAIVPTLKEHVSGLVDPLSRFTDPIFLASMKSVLVELEEFQLQLKNLGELPDGETIDTVKAKLAEIESSFTKQLWERIWEIVFSPCPTEMDINEWRTHMEKECAYIEKECRYAEEKERLKYSEMIKLFETYIIQEKMLSEEEVKLLALCDRDHEVEEIDICEKSALIHRIELSNHRLRKVLPNPERLNGLLHISTLKEVKIDIMTIFCILARMDKAFDVYIEGSNILESLKYFLTNENEDPDIRIRACKVVGNMCFTTTHFCNALKEHGIISLVADLCAHPHKLIRQAACFNIGIVASTSDPLYDDEFKRCIPHLTTMLRTKEEGDTTKSYVAFSLMNLVQNSNNFDKVIVSEGALKALIHLVVDHSRVISNVKREEDTESLISMALISLYMMCFHAHCLKFFRSSEMRPVLTKLLESQDPLIVKSRFVRYALRKLIQ